MLGFKTKVIFGTVCQRIFLGQCAREYFWDSVPEITFWTVQLEEEHGVLNFLFHFYCTVGFLDALRQFFLASVNFFCVCFYCTSKVENIIDGKKEFHVASMCPLPPRNEFENILP